MTCPEETRLEGFSTYVFPDSGDGRTVYWRGPHGRPGVILLHELPGMVEQCVDLGTELATPHQGREGLQVHMPLLFGTPREEGSSLDQAKWVWCMRSEMSMFSSSRKSPITEWVAALAADVANRTGVERVGVIGMCLTGSLVFGLIAEPSVGAVVASQPSLPFGITPWQRRSLGMPTGEFKNNLDGAAPLLAMRYRGDFICPRQRLESLAGAYEQELPEPKPGERQDEQLEGLRIIDVPGRAHALLTLNRDDDTVTAVKDFLHENLDRT